ACHNSGTAGDIEYSIACAGVSQLYKYRSPRSKHSRDQLALIHLWRAAGDLPLSLLIHLMLFEAVATSPTRSRITRCSDVRYGVIFARSTRSRRSRHGTAAKRRGVAELVAFLASNHAASIHGSE